MADDTKIEHPAVHTSAHAELLRRLAEAEKWLRLELEGPCCPGPAIHDQGADALREARAAIAQMAQQRDIELERATEYRERWQRAEARLREAEAQLQQPNDTTGQDRLLLNEYGRRCYESGERAAKAEAEAARAPLVALVEAQQQLVYWWTETGRCPCGARRESPGTHHHVVGCPTEAALSGTKGA